MSSSNVEVGGIFEVEAISHEFARLLSAEIGDDALRVVVERNRKPEYQGCCASHDFCDANMVMQQALEASGYPMPDTMTETWMGLFNDAWDQAKEYEFDL